MLAETRIEGMGMQDRGCDTLFFFVHVYYPCVDDSNEINDPVMTSNRVILLRELFCELDSYSTLTQLLDLIT